MLLAPNVVLVGILAEVCLLADATVLLEGCFISSSVGGSLRSEDLLVEDFRGDWRQGSNATF
jgi:hypothetical protein